MIGARTAAVLGWWSRRPVLVRWALVLLQVSLLWWSSSRSPGPGFVPTWRALLHNSAHVAVYAVLGGSIALALGAPLRRRAAVLAVLLAASYGAVDEWHQASVPGRACSLADLGADCAGAALGVLVLLLGLAGDRGARRCLPVALAAALTAVGLATWTSW